MCAIAEGCVLLQKGVYYCRRVYAIAEGCIILQKGVYYCCRVERDARQTCFGGCVHGQVHEQTQERAEVLYTVSMNWNSTR